MSFTLEDGDLFHNPDVESFSNVGNLSVGKVVEFDDNSSNVNVDADDSLLDGFSGIELEFGDGNLSFLDDSDSVLNNFSFGSSFNVLDGDSDLSFPDSSESHDDTLIVDEDLVDHKSYSLFGLEDENVDNLDGFFLDLLDSVSHGLVDNNLDLHNMSSGESFPSDDGSSDVD